MSPALAAAIQTLPTTAWQSYAVPGAMTDELRDVAVRVRPCQGDLFADGTAGKHFAVLSNLWEWDGARLLQWHREKAGTIDHVHDVVKNELAGGVLPYGRFGANAAWLRLELLAHNVLTALPPDLLTARPKRLRFLLFTVPGRLVTHARAAVVAACDHP